MKHSFTPAFPFGGIALVLTLMLVTGWRVQASELKFEAQLIWATNDEKSPNPKHKKVEDEIRKKLDELPLKWKSYFEVNRKPLTVAKQGGNKVALSDKCALEVKAVGGDKVEVSLFGKGEAVLKRTQSLPKGEMLVLGGNAPHKTAWLVTLKRVN